MIFVMKYKKHIKTSYDAVVFHNKIVDLVCKNNEKIDHAICRAGEFQYQKNYGASKLWNKRASHWIKRSQYLMDIDNEIVKIQKKLTEKEISRLRS